MGLRDRGGLIIALAATGSSWLGILLWLAGAVFVTRAVPADMLQGRYRPISEAIVSM
jgi:hypothetical protein